MICIWPPPRTDLDHQEKAPLVVPNIAIAGWNIPMFNFGNTSTQSGSIFKPAMLMLVYQGVLNS